MATKRSVGELKESDLKGKRVFVRVDLNVPLDDNLNITDDTRVRAAIPTIKYLMGHGARVIVSTHLAVLAPAESIASKAGVDGEIVVEKTRTCDWQTGYNAMTIRYEGLFSLELQILVGFQALQTAVSIAGVVLSSNYSKMCWWKKQRSLSQLSLKFQA
ncbi:hypothetical protein SO802_029541 [Lithocarpus litseifolius]|uniref:Phosphoglycerate kinase n=1 Tax=Lithocarpus litseifolius TaxID=425828 RepID=A0AAW2BVL0_9ROSI